MKTKNEILKGKVALITGATKGLGLAVAEELAKLGVKLSVCARSKSDIENMQRKFKSHGYEIISSVTDIGDAKQVNDLIKRTVETFGSIDLLINNASVLPQKSGIRNYSVEDWDRTIAINLSGTFYLCRTCLNVMIPRKKGCIINISSLAGRKVAPEWGAYSVSKSGVDVLSITISKEVKSEGILIYSVNPGAMRTEMRSKVFPSEDRNSVPLPIEKIPFILYLASSSVEDNLDVIQDFKSWSENV